MQQHNSILRMGAREESETSVPISPQKRLQVLGILVRGLTSIKTLFLACTYTWSSPALFNGLSSKFKRHCTRDKG